MSSEDLTPNKLSPAAADALVRTARESLELFLREEVIMHPDLSTLPVELSELGSSFVTITNHGRLRGCIGSTEARYSLAVDTARNARAAATRDYRFPNVIVAELPDVRLEVSVLTKPAELPYADYNDLVRQLIPGLHGVILTSGLRKGLLLPQVWDRLPTADQFLEMIAMKAGFPKEELRTIPPTVTALTFESHHYCEPGYQEPGG